MQRKPGFPPTNCNIKLPDSVALEASAVEDHDGEGQQKRLHLINFAHSQWGFNNWNWAVTKQDLDFVDFSNCKYSAGVVAFVSITVKSLDIHRENIGYATCTAPMKGSCIYQARKCAVTNALRETLFSFGGTVATDLQEFLDSHKHDTDTVIPTHDMHENNQNIANKPLQTLAEPKNAKNIRKDSSDSSTSRDNPKIAIRTPLNIMHPPPMKNPMPIANTPAPSIAKAHPIPANQAPPIINKPTFPANQMPPKQVPPPGIVPPPIPPGVVPPPMRPNSNVSFVLQPVMSGMMPHMYAPPPNRMPLGPPHIFPSNAYYEYAPWHFTYDGFERHHGNVNLNFNIPPKNLVVNSRSGTVECKNTCAGRPLPPQGSEHEAGPPGSYPHPSNQGCWIKPTIFYDGFWTEQKVKKWVTEQVEKQLPEDASQKSSSPSNGPPDTPKG